MRPNVSLRQLDRPRLAALVGVVVVVAVSILAVAASQQEAERTNGTGDAPDRGRSTQALVDPVAGGRSTEEFDASVAPGGDESIGATAAPAPDAASPAVVEPTTNARIALPSLDAKVVRIGSIELEVARRDFEDSWGAVQAVATSGGGYVVAATRSGAGDDARTASITMRVPTERFEAALDRLREVDGATVGRLDVTSEDVTQEYVDVRSRLRHDRAVEARLVTLLGRADAVGEVLAVQARLDAVQEQIEVARGRLTYLDRLTAMSTIDVALTAPAVGGASDPTSEPGTLREALDEAADRFVEAIAGALVWLGGALPVLLLLAVVGGSARIAWVRRARRASTHVEASDSGR
jgi:hypothetical protein